MDNKLGATLVCLRIYCTIYWILDHNSSHAFGLVLFCHLNHRLGLCGKFVFSQKNITGNGLGMVATAGEIIVQGTSGAVGLMLAPLFNFFLHMSMALNTGQTILVLMAI